MGKLNPGCIHDADKDFDLCRTMSAMGGLFHLGTRVAAFGILLANGWVHLKDPLVDPWGVFPEVSYSNNLVYLLGTYPINFGIRQHIKTYKGTLQHTSTFQGIVFEYLRRLTSKSIQIKYAQCKTLIVLILLLFKSIWVSRNLTTFSETLQYPPLGDNHSRMTILTF